MHFAKVQVMENSRAGGLNMCYLSTIAQTCLFRKIQKNTFREFTE